MMCRAYSDSQAKSHHKLKAKWKNNQQKIVIAEQYEIHKAHTMQLNHY